MKTRPIERRVWYATLLSSYALLAIVLFVLPVRHSFSEVLLGTGTYRHDAVLNAGILEWGFRSLWSPALRFFDWPPGFPLHGTLAATENLIGWQILYSPLRAAGASVAASYNTVLLSSLAISATGCAALAQRFGASRIAAAIGGIAFAFNPFHVDHMIHLQTMAVCWSPFAILGVDMALEDGSIKGLLLVAGAFAMTVLSGMYFGVFLVFVLPAYAILCWLTGRFRFSASTATTIGLTCLISGVLLLPVVRPYLDYVRSYGRYPHSGAEVSLSALSLRSLLQTPVWLGAWRASILATTTTGGFASAFPGITTLGLASAGVFAWRRDRQTTRVIIILVVLAGVCLLLAFGPTLLLRRGEPLQFTRSLPLPGEIFLHFSVIRWPMRIYMYTVLCLAVLASLGATKILEMTNDRWRNVVASCFVAAMLIELHPSEWFVQRSTTVWNPMQMSDAYSFLRNETDRGGIVELPSKMDSGLTTPFATRYAYGSSGHLRGVIAFHGSMFPPLLDSLRLASFDLPRPDAIGMMQRHGVTRLVIHNDLMSPDSSRSLVRALQAQGYPIVLSTPGSTVFSLVH